MDNQAPVQTDNTSTQPVTQPPPTETGFTWKSNLSPDYVNSPTMQKFPDTKDGFNNAVKSHLELEKMMGHDRVVIPKDEKDSDGWNKLAKALGVPDKAEQYGLPDVSVPETFKGLSFNKREFAEVAHSLKLTPGQTKTLWETYTSKAMDGYGKALQEHKKQMEQVVNQMRSEWGDSYESNVELGQMVINKFSGDKETEDYVTASLVKDPRGIKFLSKIGSQFAENKVGDFAHKNFSLSPDQAQAEIDQITNDPKHPYNDDKANPDVRKRAIDYVNNLYAVKLKFQGQA